MNAKQAVTENKLEDIHKSSMNGLDLISLVIYLMEPLSVWSILVEEKNKQLTRNIETN